MFSSGSLVILTLAVSISKYQCFDDADLLTVDINAVRRFC